VNTVVLEAGAGQDEKPAQLVLVHFQHRVEHIAVDRHRSA
jgi:hypothetical protein